MVRRLRHLLLASGLFLVMTTVAAEAERQQVLYLISNGFGASAGADMYSRHLVAALNRRGLLAANLHVEFLDLVRHQAPEHRTKLREYLLEKFAGRHFDAILLGQQAAADFMLRDLGSLSPETPVLLSTAAIPAGSEGSRRFLVQRTQMDFVGTINLALAMFPRTRHALVISGTGAQDQSIKAAAKREYDKLGTRLTFEYSDGLTLPQMQERARTLPPDSIVLFAFASRDAAGTVHPPEEFRKAITGAANAPVFGLSSVGMGSSGIIGGSLYDVEAEAARMAELTMAVVNQTLRLDESNLEFPTRGVPMFDWAQIRRWKADTRALPSNTIFFNRPPSLWDEHREAMLITGASLLALIGMVAALLVQNRRAHLAEAAVRRLNNELEDRVHRRTAELERANADLQLASNAAEAANRAKSVFLANMSHEIRTPLTGILGFAQILQRDRTLNAQQARGLKIIDESGQHLLTLINDILDLARIDAAKLDLYASAVNLPRFLQVVCDIARVKADEKSLLFVYEPAMDLPATVHVDEKRLRQVLLNLLSNAIKFTDSGGVRLRVSQLPDSPAATARLRFDVEDNGIGMSEAQLARLFTPFEQVADINRREGGTGLGLAISRQLVRLMGGDIEVHSQLGVGSTFFFEIEVPVLSTGVHASANLEPPIGYEGEHKKILVVDDAPQNRTMLVDALAPVGFQMVNAGNGREAIDLVAQHRPDLVLMDLTMPVMDGFEATRHLRSAPATARVPIIAMSASATPEAEVRSREAGASMYLSKPIDQASLFSAIATLLNLTWIRDTPASAAQAPMHADDADLVPPPPEEMAALRNLARTGNMRLISDHANHIGALDPRYAAFATRLRTLAEGYQSKAILNLVERFGTTVAEPGPGGVRAASGSSWV